LDGNKYIRRTEVFVGTFFRSVVFFFYETSCEVRDLLNEAPRAVDSRHVLSVLIADEDGGYIVFFCYAEVIGTISRGGVYNPCSILGGDKVSRDHAKGFFLQLFVRNIGKKLMVS